MRATPLSETIELAERVFVTQRHDRYAAAVLAESHLATQPAAPPLVDATDQLAWRLAQTTLREAQRAARCRPEMASALDAYHERFAIYRGLLDALDGNPESHVRERKKALRDLESKRPCLAFLGCVLLGVAFLLAPGLARAGVLVAVPAAVASATWWFRTASRERRAVAALRDAWQRANAYAAFMDSEAGLWLRMVWDRHPLLLEEAPRPVKPKSETILIQKMPRSANA